MRELLALAAGYLCGTIPFGLLLVRLFRNTDLRTVGSGNIGATNALRFGGRWLGVATLVLDALKGAGGYLLARWLWPDAASAAAWHGALALAPVLGHCFPPWLGFRGGKGVATALGVLAVVDPRLLAVGAAVFLALALATRWVALGSVGAALAVAVAGFALPPRDAPPAGGAVFPLACGIAVAAVVVIARHHTNIARLLRGTEPKLGAGARTP
ncbi:MAG: glycerol-3-phosphate 1-O-acyltransferase PlsY [Acidobacteria bacterium]|nr:glycerol-3-phosphate 1-O-acyltransferase PlsY [Acidobacteriota bacterium]